MGRAIVLLGHGTKDPEGAAEFLGYAKQIRRRFDGVVEAGVLEYPTAALPDIQAALDRAVEQGADEIVALPLFLFFAGHTQGDMPEQLRCARLRHPNTRISLAGPLGSDERLLAAVEDRAHGFGQGSDTALLLVGRGSLNSEANADLFKIARMLWDRNSYGWVEACFISVAPPAVPAGIDRCVRLGAQRIVLAPYFLNTGVLVKRIARQAQHPGVEVLVAPHLGLHANVVEVLWQRVLQAEEGWCPCQSSIPCRIPDLGCERALTCPATV